jgi:hypothetical protein|tara:strand:+ start:157 stop:330 length:174 start_codon:yes stop_codon:yes gene_type:complete
MCQNPLCRYIEICEDEWGDKYVSHYKYGADNKTLEVFFTQFWEAELIKYKPIVYNNG